MNPQDPFLLWIDDEPVRGYKLRHLGVNIVFAHGGTQVAYYLDNKPYPWRGVILDHDMPLLNGMDVVEEFLKERSLPVLICSNNVSASNRMAARLHEYTVRVTTSPISSFGFAWAVADFFGIEGGLDLEG